MRSFFKRQIALSFRQTSIGRAILDYTPCKVRFSDNTNRFVPRRLFRLFQTWDRSPEIRAEKKAVISAYKGGDFIDVGAFHGWYSLMLAPIGSNGAVFISIEPDSRALPTLYLSMALVKEYFPHISTVVFEKPAGRGESYRVSFPSGKANHPSFIDSGNSSKSRKSLTIDQIVNLCNVKPSLIKIDVEGAEADVLAGMRETLVMFKPVIMLEKHPMWLPAGLTVQELVKPLVDIGYLCSPITKFREIWSLKD